MLFWINEFDESVLSANAKILDAINNLGEAGQQGRHAVIGSKDLLRRLSSVNGISRAAVAYYKWGSAAVTQLGSLAAREDCVVIDFKVNHPVFLGNQWHVPLLMFSDQDFLGCSELICENLSDCESLIALAKLSVRKRIPSCSLKFRAVAGGGDTTHKQVSAAAVEPNPPAVCIIDSDKEFPGDGMGNTAKKCIKAGKATWRTGVRVLAARELENLIPVGAMRAIGCEPRYKDALEKFHLVDDSIYLFSCLKTGEAPCRFHEIPESHPEKDSVRIGLALTARNHPDFNCADDCSDCDCLIVPKLGDKFLSRFVEWSKNPANLKVISDLTGWKQDLVDTINTIISYGLSFPKRAV